MSLLGFLTLGQDIVKTGFKLVEAGAGNNNRVPAPVGFLGDFEKATSVIFTKLDDDVLAFDWEFAQGDGLFRRKDRNLADRGQGYQPKTREHRRNVPYPQTALALKGAQNQG